MMKEVRQYGQVQLTEVVSGLSGALSEATAHAPKSSQKEFDPSDPSKRPPGWNELRYGIRSRLIICVCVFMCIYVYVNVYCVSFC
jgi:hypothetical protein